MRFFFDDRILCYQYNVFLLKRSKISSRIDVETIYVGAPVARATSTCSTAG
jgi:hypothetical protein